MKTRVKSTKQWILASWLGALVAIALVAGISISLAPAHISFSIASPLMTKTNSTGDKQSGGNQLVQWFYNFTLVANNTSGRTWASYEHIKAEIWYDPKSWIPIDDVDTGGQMPEWQMPGNATAIAVGAKFGQYNQANGTNNKADDGGQAEGGSPSLGVYSSTSMLASGEAGHHRRRHTQEEQQVTTTTSNHAVAKLLVRNDGGPSWPNTRVVLEAKVRFRFGLAKTSLYTIRASCWPVNFANNATNFSVQCSS